MATATPYSVLSSQYSERLLAAAIALLLCFATPGVADDKKPDPIEAGKTALASSGKYPWYDRAHDDVRRLNVAPRSWAADRGDKWADNTARTKAKKLTWPTMRLFGSVLQWIGLSALVILLGLIAYLVAASFLKEEVSEDGAVRTVVESRRDADRVEALPFHVRAAAGDFLAEARRCNEAGDYSQAIIFLFSHQLVQLDRHHVLRLTKGKTNRQYVRESRRRPLLASVLQTTMVVFEDAFFGRKIITREAFERCWSRQEEFERELASQERAAA